MTYFDEDRITKEFRCDCSKCFGFCCIALYFSTFEGFPTDKDAGKPCINLNSDFTCSVHNNLKKEGLKGCITYDCIGAGQKTAQVTCNGHSWKQQPQNKTKMFEAFLVMNQLHEMLWFLAQAFFLQNDINLKTEINLLIDETEKFTLLDIDSLLALNVKEHRNKINSLLKIISEHVRVQELGGKNNSSKKKNVECERTDYFGADLRKTNLRGADLRGACLIAANLRGSDLSNADLIGADLRDTDISGADLSHSIFLTQMQINSAKGDSDTKLPRMLARPEHWLK